MYSFLRNVSTLSALSSRHSSRLDFVILAGWTDVTNLGSSLFVCLCLSFSQSGHLVFAVPMRSAKSLVTILCTILLQPIDHGNFWHLHLTSNRQLQSFVTFICTSLICIQIINEVGNLLWQAVWLLTVMKTALPFSTKPAPIWSLFPTSSTNAWHSTPVCVWWAPVTNGRSSQTIYIWALHHQISFSLKLHPECKFNGSLHATSSALCSSLTS